MFKAWLVIFIFCILGCSTAHKNFPNNSQQAESSYEAESAMNAVVGAVAGNEAGPVDVRQLEKQLRNDKEAQSAVESITGAISDSSIMGKYCPIDGERYSSKFEKCPKHNVLLKNIEE